MSEAAARPRPKEPSHIDLLEQINGRFDLMNTRFDRIETRLDHGEKRFDGLEEKIDADNTDRAAMATKLAVLEVKLTAAAENNEKPWYFGWKPLAAIVALTLMAGAGLAVVTIAGFEILPALTAIKDAVQP